MKILIINDDGFKAGGAESYIFNLKNELEKLGHIVKILSTNTNPDKVHFNDYSIDTVINNSVFNALSRLFNFKSYIEIKKIIDKYNPDIIHLNIIDRISPSILLRFSKIPTVMTVHGFELIYPPNSDELVDNSGYKHQRNYYLNFCNLCLKIYYNLKFYMYKYYLKKIDLFLANSYYIKKKLSEHNILNCEVLYLGINLPKVTKFSDSNNILYIGRLHKFKGVKYLLEAFNIVISQIPDMRLNIIGEGPEKNNLKKTTEDLKITKNVNFINWKSEKELDKFINNSMAVIMPSIWPEPFGLVGIESLSFGKPVIASNIGGIPEWLDKNTGFLVKPGDANEIADKILFLANNISFRRNVSVNALIMAEKFGIKKHASEIVKIYSRLIDEKSRLNNLT